MQLEHMSFTVDVSEEEVSSFSSQFETYFVATKKKYDISADLLLILQFNDVSFYQVPQHRIF